MATSDLLPPGFRLPRELASLIEQGVWPQSPDDARRQSRYPLIGPERAAHFGFEWIFLDVPPFTLPPAQLIPSAPGLEKSVFIANFGDDSYTAIALDYRALIPTVIGVLLGGEQAPESGQLMLTYETFEIASSVAEFLELVGLEPGGEYRWHSFSGGQTIGQPGSEGGEVVLDDEHGAGARITVEVLPDKSQAVTCGVYGSMVHTRFFRSTWRGGKEILAMKADLVALAKTNEGFSDFIAKFP